MIRRNALSRRHVLLGVAAAFGAAGFGIACRRTGDSDAPDRGKVLEDLSTIVIVPAYAGASSDAKELETSVGALKSSPSIESLAAARASWKKARAAWKVTDAFLFGPAADLALTGGAIDTTPDQQKIELNAAPTSTSTLDEKTVPSLGANQRGFGALEVLLFDPARDDAAMLAAFQSPDARRSTLASLVAIDLRVKIEKVRDAWTTATPPYGSELAKAGRGSAAYPSERQGVDVVVNGLIATAEVIIALRLAKPLGIDKTPATPQPSLVESNRSDASIDDILAALEGVERVYLGRDAKGAKGLPLADAVAERSPSADEHMRSLLEKAKTAVKQIQGPLRTAVTERRDPVIAAHAAVRELKRCLSAEIAGALGTSVGFGVTDGD